MDIIELLKALLLGIVEGITEWLPISSTGHMILLDEFLKLNVSAAFKDMFLVVIQLGAILAVVVLYFKKLWPFAMRDKKPVLEKEKVSMWLKIIVSCVPAAIVGLLFDDQLEALFYNWQTVALMLVIFGIAFIIIEKYNKKKEPTVHSIRDLSYRAAFIIGLFQLIAAVFPGTSRSGATIVGALLIGVSRTVAAEYTFFLAVPVMFGASAYKILKFILQVGLSSITGAQWGILLIGSAVAFIVSLFAIKFLMNFIRKHDFTAFGWYRIVLGIVVILYFGAQAVMA